MTLEQTFGAEWYNLTSKQRRSLRKISAINEQELKPALTRLSILCEHCVATNQQEVLFECGLIDYDELQLVNEGLWDKVKDVAKQGAEKVRRPPQKGELSSEEEIKELFTFIIMQHEGTDVNSIKDAMGGAWDDAVTGVKDVGTGIKNTGSKVMQAMKAVNEALNKVGREVQKLGVVENVDTKVDEVLTNFKQKHQDGKLVKLAEDIGNYAKEHPVKAALPIVILTMATTLAVGPGLLPVAVGMLLRTGLGMVKNPNESLSSAIGGAAKVTALGMGLGASLSELGEIAFPADEVGEVINTSTLEVIKPDWLEEVAALDSAQDLTSDQAKALLTYHHQLQDALQLTNSGSDAMSEVLSGNPGLVDEIQSQITIADDAIKQLGGQEAIMAKVDPGAAEELKKLLGGASESEGNVESGPRVGPDLGDDFGNEEAPSGNIERPEPPGEQTDFSSRGGAAHRLAEINYKKDLAAYFANQMGIENPENFKMQGGLPVLINGQPVPEDLYSPEELKNINAAREAAAAMGNRESTKLNGQLWFEAVSTDTSKYMQ